jgi:hypothetical protein
MLLALPPDRIKIIRAGRKLPPVGNPALKAALVSGTYMVSGTRKEDALPSNAHRWMTEVADTARDIYSQCTWALLSTWLLWLWTLLTAVPRTLLAFVSSAVIAPRPAAGQAPRRADVGHVD